MGKAAPPFLLILWVFKLVKSPALRPGKQVCVMVHYRLGMSKHEDTEGAMLEGSWGKPMGKGMSEEKRVRGLHTETACLQTAALHLTELSKTN